MQHDKSTPIHHYFGPKDKYNTSQSQLTALYSERNANWYNKQK